MAPEASIICGSRAGTVQPRIPWQHHHNGPHNDKIDEDSSQDYDEYDDDNKGGFGIDVGSHL